jgi:hypothetical protein
MFAKARVVGLVIGASLVGMVSFANAQIALVNQKLDAFKFASLEDAGSVLSTVSIQQMTLTLGFVKNALSGDPIADKLKKDRARQLYQAIIRRDAAGKELGDAITETMKTMNPNNKQDVKRLEQVYDEIQAINKTTNDALLRYDETLTLLDEQAAAEAQQQ